MARPDVVTISPDLSESPEAGDCSELVEKCDNALRTFAVRGASLTPSVFAAVHAWTRHRGGEWFSWTSDGSSGLVNLAGGDRTWDKFQAMVVLPAEAGRSLVRVWITGVSHTYTVWIRASSASEALDLIEVGDIIGS